MAGLAAQALPHIWRPLDHAYIWGIDVFVQDLSPDQEIAVNPLDFTLEWTDGTTMPSDPSSYTFAPVTLPPGGHMRGRIGFELPYSATMHYLIWRPTGVPALQADFTGGP